MTIDVFHLEERSRRGRGRVWQGAPWERFEARGVIASALAIAALTAAATAGGTAVASAIGSHAAGQAATTTANAATTAAKTSADAAAAATKTSTDAQLEAARIAAKATADSTAAQLQYERDALAATTGASSDQLAFLKGQAALSRQDAETNREGDYEQWAAREGRLSTIGGMLGLPARQIPGYRPLGPDTSSQFAGSGGGSAPPANPALMPKQGEVDWTASPDQLSQQLSSYFQARGVAPSEVPYWVQHAGDLVARGRQINDPQYADKRLSAAEVFGSGGGAPPAAAAAPAGGPGGVPASTNGAPAPGSIASLTRRPYQPLTAPYQAPRIVMPGSIRSFASAA